MKYYFLAILFFIIVLGGLYVAVEGTPSASSSDGRPNAGDIRGLKIN